MKKKQNTVFGVIGLGRFGEALAMMLAESENEVIVVLSLIHISEPTRRS